MKTKYRCENFGDCDQADSFEPFELDEHEEKKCPKCGRDDTLAEESNGIGTGRNNPLINKLKTPLVAGIIGGVALLGGGAYYCLSDGSLCYSETETKQTPEVVKKNEPLLQDRNYTSNAVTTPISKPIAVGKPVKNPQLEDEKKRLAEQKRKLDEEKHKLEEEKRQKLADEKAELEKKRKELEAKEREKQAQIQREKEERERQAQIQKEKEERERQARIQREKNKKYSLIINKPSGSRVILVNLPKNMRYYDGIKIKNGTKVHIRIKKDGFKTKDLWVKMNKNIKKTIHLERKPRVEPQEKVKQVINKSYINEDEYIEQPSKIKQVVNESYINEDEYIEQPSKVQHTTVKVRIYSPTKSCRDDLEELKRLKQTDRTLAARKKMQISVSNKCSASETAELLNLKL